MERIQAKSVTTWQRDQNRPSFAGHSFQNLGKQRGYLSQPRTIQRVVRWEGREEKHFNLTDVPLHFEVFGNTPVVINGTEVPNVARTVPSILGPALLIEPADSGGVAVSVAAPPINIVGYRMLLPTDPPWTARERRGYVCGAVGPRACEAAGLDSDESNENDQITLNVQGLPSNAEFVRLVKVHEQRHVRDWEGRVREILLAWDQNIRQYMSSGAKLTAPDERTAIALFYESIGGTPEEIRDKLLKAAKEDGEAFHETPLGQPPDLVPARTTFASGVVTLYYQHATPPVRSTQVPAQDGCAVM